MKIAKTAPDALKILWREKVFLKPKDVNTIESEIEKRGYDFADKNLMMVLKSTKFLTRKGQAGSYSYVQKYPFIGDDDDEK
jgi:hypothetical protein